MLLLDQDQLWQVGLLQKLMFLLFLSLLVFGEERQESLVISDVGLTKQSPTMHGKQLKRSLRHSFDALFSSKRKVPNAADPLHNR
ncbi:hypothetical protein L484_010243 [Morus notabilis]|uniref:Uncharacterized protein n=1 Tax=Morus notabilis TaxID=981085 RepID=W9RZI5_9ROSA|nr:hypothetical protein L484_010243 [Morus notabilis]